MSNRQRPLLQLVIYHLTCSRTLTMIKCDLGKVNLLIIIITKIGIVSSITKSDQLAGAKDIFSITFP